MPTIAQHLSPASSGCFLQIAILCVILHASVTFLCNRSHNMNYQLTKDAPPSSIPRKIHFSPVNDVCFTTRSTHLPRTLRMYSTRVPPAKRGGATLAIISLCVAPPLALRGLAVSRHVRSSRQSAPRTNRPSCLRYGTFLGVVEDRLVVGVVLIDADGSRARIMRVVERADAGLALVLNLLAVLQQGQRRPCRNRTSRPWWIRRRPPYWPGWSLPSALPPFCAASAARMMPS